MSRVFNGAPVTYAGAAVTYSGPPADRMAGRPSVMRAARASAPRTPATQPQRQPQRVVSDAHNAVDWQHQSATQASTRARSAAIEDGGALIARAVVCGVIGANMAAHYTELYRADPQGTKDYLVALGLPRESPVGQAMATNDYPTSGLSRAEREHIAGARAGEAPRYITGGL